MHPIRALFCCALLSVTACATTDVDDTGDSTISDEERMTAVQDALEDVMANPGIELYPDDGTSELACWRDGNDIISCCHGSFCCSFIDSLPYCG